MKHFDVFTNSWYTTHVGGFDISATTEEGGAEHTRVAPSLDDSSGNVRYVSCVHSTAAFAK